MEIEEIYNDVLYSIKFDDCDLNEFDAAFTLWSDLEYLSAYFERNKLLLESPFWKENNLNNNAEAIKWILKDSVSLKKRLFEWATNSQLGLRPDLDFYFEPLMGQYSYVHQLVPSKGYGVNHPSMLRLYAIKISSNCYLVVHGGIKLSANIAGTPELEEIVFIKIENVLRFLKNNAIEEPEDLTL